MDRHAQHWYILGAGSMGLLWAYHLQKNHPVSLINKQATIARQNFNYLNNDAKESFSVQYFTQQSQEKITYLLVCTKAQQSAAAISAIKANIAEDAVIVLLQNGMGNEDWLAEQFPSATLVKAITTEAAFKPNQQSICHTATGVTTLGLLQSSAQSTTQSNSQLKQLFTTELVIATASNIEQLAWQKLAVNCVINPLTAIHNCLNGQLKQLENIDELIQGICLECVGVAKALGVELETSVCIAEVNRVINATANNSSSMREDMLAKRSSEIDYINGYVCRKAKQLAIATEHNQYLFEQIKKQEAYYD